jgi:mannose-6-phosphate isomerase-like protein (cupin superfamily)
MSNRAITYLAVASVFFLYSFQGHASESAISYSIHDESIEWGPCPAFFPPGCQIGVLHGDPAKPNVDIFFKVPGNYDYPAHWHTSPERMILLSGSLNVNYRGQPTTKLKTGMYAYGPAKAVHDARCISDEPCVLFIAFEDPLDAVEFASPAQ